jgi:hypothetical protein
MVPLLFHVSEQPDIVRFVPRPAPSGTAEGEMVWAVDDAHLHNYLLPRDCPRVTFYPAADSLPADVERLMGGDSRPVVAIESRWFDAARNATLYRYRLPAEPFTCIDSGAGYWISREAVAPVSLEALNDPLGELLRRGIQLRVLPSLWDLRDRVIASSLQFSIIRMRNAAPRDAVMAGFGPVEG